MKGSIKTKLDELAYKRDLFRCVVCGKETGIEAHHIERDIEEIDNLVTLCHSCHKKSHNMAGCFTSDDERRNTRIVARRHPFWGNKWVQIPSQ